MVAATASAPKAKGEKESTKKLKIQKPNEAEFQQKILVERNIIKELRQKIDEVTTQIDGVTAGRDEYNDKKNDHRVNLDKLTGRVDELENERKGLILEIDNQQKQSRVMKQNAATLKKSIGVTSEEEMEKRIRDIEERMMTSTLSLKEEKEMMAKIAQLKKDKPLIGKSLNMEVIASSHEDNWIIPLKLRLDALRDELIQLKEAKRKETEKYKELVADRQSVTNPVRDLIETKKNLFKDLNAHRLAERELQDSLNAELAAWRAHMRKIQTEETEKRLERKLNDELEHERMALERELEKTTDLPLEDEVLLLTQTITYVKKLMDPDLVKVDEPTTSKAKVDIPENDGKALLPKNCRDEEFYFAPKAKKGKAKQGGGAKSFKSKTITHDIGTLTYFEQCGVQAPVNHSDLEGCLESLQAKLDEYKSQQQVRIDSANARKDDILEQMQVLDYRSREIQGKKP